MNKGLHPYIEWFIRLLIAVLFFVSALAKLYPVWLFEKQMVDLGIVTWTSAPYLSRGIIALELSIGIMILLPFLTRKMVIPITILLLLAFCFHLATEMIKHGPMTGNCGCFGQLIPMTPLEAFLKNILTIGLLIWLYRLIKIEFSGIHYFFHTVSIYFFISLLLFIFFPISTADNSVTVEKLIKIPDTTLVDYSENPSKKKAELYNNKYFSESGKKNDTLKKEIIQPPKVNSKFSSYQKYGSQIINPDDGKKLICMFSPGCDHCKEVAKELSLLSLQPDFPEILILFMDEDADKINEFFSETGKIFPYSVLSIPVFWQLLGVDANTPGVFYIWNGNIIRFFEGTENNKFNSYALKEILKKGK